MQLVETGTMSLEETFGNLAAFLNSLDAEGEQKFELSHSLVIICPDCGKNIAFRGRCPKCGGNSWIPAGHAGGIFERMKAQRWRTMMREEDDSLNLRPRRETRRAPSAARPTTVEPTAIGRPLVTRRPYPPTSWASAFTSIRRQESRTCVAMV